MSTRFFDTNVILPAFHPRHANHAAAVALLTAAGAANERPHVSVNVLGELYAGFTRALVKGGRPLLTPKAALDVIVADVAPAFTVHDVLRVDWDRVVAAKRRFPQIPVWDGLLWAAAKRASCSELLTEDAPGGLEQLDGVRFVNPFA